MKNGNALRKTRKVAPYVAGAVIALGAGKAVDIVKSPDKPASPKSVEYRNHQAIVTPAAGQKMYTQGRDSKGKRALASDKRQSFFITRPESIRLSEDGEGGLVATQQPSGEPVDELTIHIGDPSKLVALDHDGNKVFFPGSGELNRIPADGKIGLQVSSDAQGHRVEQEVYITTVPPDHGRP